MKTIKLFLIFFLIFSFKLTKAQVVPNNRVKISPDGLLDAVFDKDGNSYQLKDILIDPALRGSTNAKSSLLCSSGYFNVYFEAGSGMDGGSTAEVARRNVVCQVLSDLSAFINSPLTSTGKKVNIWVRNINNISSVSPTTLGLATGFYNVPYNNTIGFGGIADNEITKTIWSGKDSYINVVSPLISSNTQTTTSGAFYHGMMAFNFSNPNINWHTTLSILAPNGFYDLYSVVLHEMTHALGFASLINYDGLSRFGNGFNYYTRYDLFLKNTLNQKLITNTSNCSIYNYQFALTPSELTPGCTDNPPTSNTNSNNTNCNTAIKFVGTNTVPVYTPTCYETGSSLSHFEDGCYPTNPPANGNDLYFVMSNANVAGVNKRYLKPEERSTLCDLGYAVNITYGTLVNQTFFNYGGSPCNKDNSIGINDGITSTGVYQFVGSANTTILISGILSNDYNGNTFECLEDVYDPTATLSTTIGNTTTVITFSSNIPGIHLLRYVPISSIGVKGSITYIYVFIKDINCAPSSCDLVNNGSFSNANVSQCGPIYNIPSFGSNLDCWFDFSGSPDLFVRNCTNIGNNFNTANNTFGSTPPADSHNGAPNNNFIGLAVGPDGTTFKFEVVNNLLASPLIPGQQYELSFWARVNNTLEGLFSNFPANIRFASTENKLAPPSTLFITQNFLNYASSSVALGNLTVVPADLTWHYFKIPFTFNGSVNHNALYIFYESLSNPIAYHYVFLDDISIKPVSLLPVFNLPNQLCGTNSISDLSIYLTPAAPGGVFSGPGVVGNAFNPILAGLGNHTIFYSYTNSAGCPIVLSDVITVLNSNLNINIIPSATTICAGGSLILNLNGASNYLIQPGNISTTGSITLTPTVTTNYIVSGTTSVGCGTAQVTVNVTSVASCCLPFNKQVPVGFSNPLSTYYTQALIGTTTISNQVIEVLDNASLVINYPVTFNNCKFRMGMSAKIILNIVTGTNKTITFENNCEFYACGNFMWRGIVDESGTYTVNINDSKIEDANVGVSLYSTSTLNLNKTVFNKNYIAVQVPSQNSSVAIAPCTFKGNTFSCAASANSPTATLKQVKPLGTSTFITPARSYAGIIASFNNTNTILRIGSSAAAADLNTFSNLDYGIYLSRTRAEIYNNTFNIPLRTDNQDYSYGTAIYATTNTTPVYGHNMTIGGTATNQKNTFTSCYRGIDLNTGYDNIQIRNNIFNGTMTNLGTDGIILNNDRMLSLFCTSNNFSFQRNAFTHYFNGYPQFSDINSTTRVCSFSANTIQNNGLSNKGIIIANLGSANTAINGRYTIAGNTIFGAAPISITDLANAIEIQTCTLTVKNNITLGSQNVGIDINNSNKAFLEKNVIASDAPAIANCTNQNIFGIKVTNSQQVQIKCNTLSKLGSLVAFSGNCQSPGNGLYGNNLVSGKYGLRFINNAIIGQQSWSTTSPQSSKNVWGVVANFPTTISGRQTYIENATINPNVSSKLYLNSFPTLNASQTNPLFAYTSPTGLVSAFIVTDECGGPPPVPAAAPVAAMSSAIQPAVNNTGVTDNNAKMLNKQAAYNLIEDMPSLKTVSSLNTFYNNNSTGCVGKLRQVQDKIRLGNFTSAKAINSSFNPNCDAETHTKNYYDLYIKWKTDTLCCDSLFRNDVLTIANACPEKHGIVVNKAQALYNLITKSNNVFTANCNTGSGSRILNTTPNTNNDEENKAVVMSTLSENVSIAPNPNNGQFTIQFANTHDEKVNIVIRDASQKLLFDSKVEVKERQIKLDLAYLKSGVYFAYINDNTGTQKVLKFVVANNE